MAENTPDVRLQDATLGQLAEAIATGIVAAVREVAEDAETFKALRRSVEAADSD
jgi:hypothetical protein